VKVNVTLVIKELKGLPAEVFWVLLRLDPLVVRPEGFPPAPQVILWSKGMLNTNKGILLHKGGQPGYGPLLRHPSDPHGVYKP
jgi:hypothetical protein